MKCLAILIIAFAALVAADDKEWKPISDREGFARIDEDCKKEDGVIPGLNEDDPREKQVRISAVCPALKIGIFSLDKGFDVERIIAQYKAISTADESIRDIIVGCIGRNEENSSITGWVDTAKECMARKVTRAAFQNEIKGEIA